MASPADAPAGEHVLDNVVRSSLTGPHAVIAETRGLAVRYPVDVAPFAGLPDEPEPQDWADLAALSGSGALVVGVSLPGSPPAGWQVVFEAQGVQLVDAGVDAAPDGEARSLGPDDVPDMLALVDKTRPGPFLQRTIQLGTYLGIRRGGVLVAMAGERMHPAGWTEISAVCTDVSVRQQGLAGRLIRAVAHGVHERGETPFLHAAADNTGAVRLYEALGFEVRRGVVFRGFRTP